MQTRVPANNLDFLVYLPGLAAVSSTLLPFCTTLFISLYTFLTHFEKYYVVCYKILILVLDFSISDP